jgi:phosphate transport system substrate-binding protein
MWYVFIKKSVFSVKVSENSTEGTTVDAGKAFAPIIAGKVYFILIWIITFGASGYLMDATASHFFAALAFPYLLVNAVLDFGGIIEFFPVVVIAETAVIFFVFLFAKIRTKSRLIYGKKRLIPISVIVVIFAVIGLQFYGKSQRVLSADSSIQQFREMDNIYFIEKEFGRPLEVGNKFTKLDEPAEIEIKADYPILDGATAAYPVYAAMAQEIYIGLDVDTFGEYVSCSKTEAAYKHLAEGKADIFFGAQPSDEQMAYANSKGLELVKTPIGREAFVFFVNADNPVNSLTTEQIQNIYQKKSTNRKSFGGNNEKIIPFQRPGNSGSQTIMEDVVMKGKFLPEPLMEENAGSMGGIIDEVALSMGGIIHEVALYRNYTSAIGYSFRYFATQMNPNVNVKLLAIDATLPTVENILNGTYPLTVDVYAVTAGQPEGNAKELIDWILTEQGQRFVEKCGYVGL